MASLSQALKAVLAASTLASVSADTFFIDESTISETFATSQATLAAGNFELIGSFATLSFNHAPSAAPDAVTRSSGDDIKIDIRQLLANDFDPEAEDLTIQLPGFSDAGVPLQVQGGWIFYIHNSPNPDSITYTVSDPYGATSGGRIDIQIAGPDNQTTTRLRISVDGSGAHLTFAGIKGRNYRVQSRDQLDDPWTDRAIAVDLGLGRYRFDDSTGNATRFYRVVYRP